MTSVNSFSKEIIADYTASGYWGTMTCIDYLEKHVQEHPDKEAIVDNKKRINFAKFGQMIDKLVLAFAKIGVTEGDIVGIQLPNCIEYYYVRYALAKIGAISMPIPVTHRTAEVEYALGRTEAIATVIRKEFHDFDYLQMIKGISNKLPALRHIIVMSDEMPPEVHPLRPMIEIPRGENLATSRHRFKPDANAVDLLLLTSGTTGVPKIVMFTPNGWLYMGMTEVKKYRAEDRDIILCLAPLSGGIGNTNGIAIPVLTGAKVVVQDRFVPEEALTIIEKEKVSIAVGVPTQAIRMLEVPNFSKYNLESLRVWSSIGSLLSSEIAKRVEEKMGCRIINVYGCIEGGIGTITDPEDDARYTTVGRCVEGTQLKLVDENDLEVPIGQIGEVLIKAPSGSAGYYKDPKATQEIVEADGYVHTGDLGILDKRGYLKIIGRKKDVINRGGTKISAEEVEDHIRTYPKILDVAIVAMPDRELGEKSCAYVICHPKEQLTLQELTSFLRQRGVATFKLPERLELVDKFPLSAGGKILKRALREDIAKKLEREDKRDRLEG